MKSWLQDCGGMLAVIVVAFAVVGGLVYLNLSKEPSWTKPAPTVEVLPSYTPAATPEPTPTPEPVTYACCLKATRYGESYNGQPFGCYDLLLGRPVGYYSSRDTSILAAPPALYSEWPCGTQLELCTDNGCVRVTRVDSCPGCGPDHVDLSEDGIAKLCGRPCDIQTDISYRVIPQSLVVRYIVLPGEEGCREALATREERCK